MDTDEHIELAREPREAEGPFLAAAKEGRTAEALALLKEIPDPWNVRSPHGECALHWAAANDDLKLLEALAIKGCPANISNDRGTHPLHYAALNNSGRACHALLIAAADPRVASGFSGEYPDQAAKDPGLKAHLGNARERIEVPIARVPALHLSYRVRRWGHDSLDMRLLRGRTTAITWGEGCVARPDLDPSAAVPDLVGKMGREWLSFQARVDEFRSGTLDVSRLCAYCGATGPGKLRCARCKVVWFCGAGCQKAAWPLHKTIGCAPAERGGPGEPSE